MSIVLIPVAHGHTRHHGCETTQSAKARRVLYACTLRHDHNHTSLPLKTDPTNTYDTRTLCRGIATRIPGSAMRATRAMGMSTMLVGYTRVPARLLRCTPHAPAHRTPHQKRIPSTAAHHDANDGFFLLTRSRLADEMLTTRAPPHAPCVQKSVVDTSGIKSRQAEHTRSTLRTQNPHVSEALPRLRGLRARAHARATEPDAAPAFESKTMVRRWRLACKVSWAFKRALSIEARRRALSSVARASFTPSAVLSPAESFALSSSKCL